MAEFQPFADDTAVVTIGGLTIENGAQRVSISGALDVTRDATGRAQIEALKAVVDAVHQALAAGPRHGSEAQAAAGRTTRKNPFA